MLQVRMNNIRFQLRVTGFAGAVNQHTVLVLLYFCSAIMTGKSPNLHPPHRRKAYRSEARVRNH
jgi:hypothetical protein